jgi:hypothetical protein
VPIDPKKCCGMHSLEKEKSGECCQLDEKGEAEQATYEHHINLEPTRKEEHE